MLYMATGKPAHLGCKFLSDVSVVNSPIVVELLVITALFCVVLPLRRIKTQLLHLVGLISLLYNIQQFCVLPTQCIYVFCVDLRTYSDYFPIQH